MRLRASKRSSPSRPRPPSRSSLRQPVEERLVALELNVRIGVEDVDQRQVVALADLEVVEVVRGRDLHRAGALLRVGIVVGDDRDRRPTSGRTHVLADQVPVALVVGMHGDGRVAQHGLGPGGRDGDRAVRARPRADRGSARDCPSTSICSTSRSEIAVWNCGSQFTRRLSL